MNKPSEQNPTTPARAGDQTQPGKGVPPSFDSQQPQDSRETAPDTGKKADAGKSSYLPGSGREDIKPPLHAARGDDDLMSKKPGKQG